MPNHYLAGSQISNIRRSPNQWTGTEFYINFSTPPEKMEQLRKIIADFIEDNREDFCPNFAFWPFGFGTSTYVEYGIYVQHRNNFQNTGLFRDRNARLFTAVVKALKDLNIEFMTQSKMTIDQATSQTEACGISDARTLNIRSMATLMAPAAPRFRK